MVQSPLYGVCQSQEGVPKNYKNQQIATQARSQVYWVTGPLTDTHCISKYCIIVSLYPYLTQNQKAMLRT